MLWLVYTFGWLPALAFGYGLRPNGGAAFVLSAAGETGWRGGYALAASLAILTAAYVAAIRRPPAARTLVAACTGSLLAALALPVLFSADVYAYAYYGDLALHDRNPYSHALTPPQDALGAAAVAAWNGHVPPRCVYGPAAVGIAALADVAGAAGRVAGMIWAQRLAAAAAYATCVALLFRLVRDARARVVFALNPVVIWSVAEGHNDAAMLALTLAGLGAVRYRPLLFALAVLVKAPALIMWTRLEIGRPAVAALGLAVLGYAPLVFALVSTPDWNGAPAQAAAWQSPLGLLAAQIGRLPAAGFAGLAVATAAFAVQRLRPTERVPAFALAAWFSVPNAYPWYALWIVPLAARNVPSFWARALLVASLVAPARTVIDAVFRAGESSEGTDPFHLTMIAIQYVPPLAYLAVAGLRRRSAVALVTLVAVLACGMPAVAVAQSTQPSPVPATAPGAPSPAPTAAQAGPPQAQPQAPPPLQPPATSVPAPSPLPAPQTAVPAASPVATAAPVPPSPVVTLPPAPPTVPPLPVVTFAPTAAPVETPNPFTYIITPPAIAATVPDGPHIIQVDLNDRHIRAGGPLVVRVFTSANVVGVEARALGRFIPIPQNSPGLFSLAYTMPGGIPFWLLNKNYNIVIAAATADGRQTSVSFPMLLTAR